MHEPSTPRRRTKAVLGLSLAAGLAATGITVAAADPADAPDTASGEAVADVRQATAGFTAEVDRVTAIGEYAEAVAVRDYALAVYQQAVEWRGAAAYARAQAAEAEYAGGAGGHLATIRACESGGDYSAVSSSGTYRGAYQFDQQTWESVGGSGDPAAASPAEQDMRAQLLYEQRGASPWPVCGS